VDGGKVRFKVENYREGRSDILALSPGTGGGFGTKNRTFRFLRTTEQASAMTLNDNPTRRPRRTTNYTVAALIAVVLVAVIGAAVWNFNTHTSQPGTALTGEAKSVTGSTTVGAPAGTPPSETTGQAVSPSGSSTTGTERQ
jgi:hypothetical protein